MSFNFSGRVNTRQINYTGRSQTQAQTKSDIIEQARIQREQRLHEQLRLNNSIRIQSLYRGYRCRKHIAQYCRQQYDTLIQQHNNTQFNVDTLILLIRYINAICTHKQHSSHNKHYSADLTRLTQLSTILAKSIKSTDTNQCYQSLLLHNHTTQLQWLVQCRHLCHILLQLCDNVQYVTNEQIAVHAALLNILLDINQSPLLKQAITNNTALHNTINTVYSQLYKYVQPVFYTSIQHRLLELTPLVDAQSHTNNSNAKHKVSILSLFALSIKPLFIQQNTYFTVNDHITFVNEFITQILTMPLLNYRLQSAQLHVLLNSLIQPTLYTTLLQQIATVITQLKSSEQPSHTYYDTTVIQKQEDKRTVEHKQQDDEDEINGLPKRHRILQPLNACMHNIVWLFGNILYITTLGQSDKQYDTVLVDMLSEFIDIMTADDFNGISQHNRLLIEQYNILKSNTITRLCTMLTINTPANSIPQYNSISTISQIIDTLLYKWSTGAFDMLSNMPNRNSVVQILWYTLVSSNTVNDVISNISNNNKQVTELSNQLLNCVSLLCCCYSHQLIITHDTEFFDKQTILKLDDVNRLIEFLKYVLYRAYYIQYDSNNSANIQLRERGSKLLSNLRDRQARRNYTNSDVWILPNNLLSIDTVTNELIHDTQHTGRTWQFMQSIPFLIAFEYRVQLFYKFIDEDKNIYRNGINGSIAYFDHGMGARVTIHRNDVLHDGYTKLSKLGTQLKGRIQIEFINEYGVQENGIDGGGIFKEFLNTLLKSAFNPQAGLFCETETHFLYPNPHLAHTVENTNLYYFCGQMIGKALYDGITVETQFCNFFLRLLLNQTNTVDDLNTFDAQFYNSLIYLKNTDDDVSALDLTFSVDTKIGNRDYTIDLIENGSNITVNKQNKLQFIYLISHYKLNKQIQWQTQAFLQGINNIFNTKLLQFFTADQLCQLIAGVNGQRIDWYDLQQFTVYAGGYSQNHEAIQWFWSIVNEFTPKQQTLLLKFITSCSRAPLLGFKSLEPKFAIQRTKVDEHQNNFPTAATCMNLLRLPRYTSKQKMKEKLIYAIENASSGFGLT